MEYIHTHHLSVVCGCFCSMKVESSSNGDCMCPTTPKILTIDPLQKKKNANPQPQVLSVHVEMNR